MRRGSATGETKRNAAVQWDALVARRAFPLTVKYDRLTWANPRGQEQVMMTHVVALWRGPTHNFTGAWIFVVVVLAIIVLIFVRVYGPRSWPWRPTGRGGRRAGQTVHRVSEHEVQQHRARTKGRPKGSGSRHH